MSADEIWKPIINCYLAHTVFELLKIDLTKTKTVEHGQYTFPCFRLAPMLKKSPEEIAKLIVENIKMQNIEAKAEGGYVNFYIDTGLWVKSILGPIFNATKGNGKKDE